MKMSKKYLFVFLLVFFSPYLFAASDSESTTEYSIPRYEMLLTQQTQGNYNSDSEMLQQNLNEQRPPFLDPSNPWESLRELISEGLQGLSDSSESLNLLERELAALKVETTEQKGLYEELQRLLTALKQSLAEAQNSVDIAIDRMQDAENYAYWIDGQNELLKLQVQRYRKSGIIGFSFGGISFSVGVPLIIEGIRADNQTMMWSGAGVIVGTGVIWAL